MMKIKVKETQATIAQDVRVAKTMSERMIGLMFSDDIPKGDGLLIMPCNSIHTFFMRYPIDVLFLDKNNVIVKMYRSLAAWRITPIVFTSKKVLELRAGSLSDDLKIGMSLEVENV